MRDLSTTEPDPYVLAIIDPDRDDIRRLISSSDLYLASLYPAESSHLTDLAVLASPDVTFYAALCAGEAVGCGALVRTGPGAGFVEIEPFASYAPDPLSVFMEKRFSE
jgi:putative acetyltransferase